MVYFSIQPELKELKEFELLDEEEQLATKDQIQHKIMDKFKKNEKRVTEITQCMHILLIHSKITKVLDKLFVVEDLNIKWMYIDSLIIMGSVFLNH